MLRIKDLSLTPARTSLACMLILHKLFQLFLLGPAVISADNIHILFCSDSKNRTFTSLTTTHTSALSIAVKSLSGVGFFFFFFKDTPYIE